MLIFRHEDLARLEAGQLHLISEDRESNQLLEELWGAVKTSTIRADFLEYGDPPLPVAGEWHAFRQAEAVSADSASALDFGKLSPRRASRIGLSEEGRKERRKISGNAGSIDRTTRFPQAAKFRR